MKKDMKTFVADELSYKVYHLTKALEETTKILNLLEKENKELKIQIEFLLEKNLVAA
jgi:hypothetical protein